MLNHNTKHHTSGKRPARTSSSSSVGVTSVVVDEAVRPAKGRARHARVLENNRMLLANNIVWSADFDERLSELSILPLSMLRDVKAISRRVDRSAALVAHLQRLGPKHFNKFCDLLHVTGHVFLADHLREEVSQKGKHGGSNDDIIRKLPVLQNALSLYEQHLLAAHIKDQVNEALTRSVWRAETEAKSRLSQQRNLLLQEDVERTRTLRDKDAQIERQREALAELRQTTEHQKAAISGLEKERYAIKCRHAAEVQKLSRAYQATERCNARETSRVTMFDTQVKALNAKIAKHLGVADATSSTNAVYLGSDNVKMSRLEENVARLLRRLEALQALTDSTKQQDSDDRLELLDVMQLPRSTGNVRLACCRVMSKIYVAVQALQKDVDKITAQLGIVDSSASTRLNTGAYDRAAERIHGAIATVKNDLAHIHRRINESGVTATTTLKRKHKISVGSTGSSNTTSPLSPKTPLPSPSPRWPLQHQRSRPNQLPSVRDSRQSREPEKRRFFGDDWNRTLPAVSHAMDGSRQKGSHRKQGTFLAS